ncbi:metallophosphoesterase [Geoglobus acetivorans]|uniref:Phosphoesterase n=1 Tax=Geoglobus acetivorans TaxID=565033 RepID=A0A0A7GFC5_GEOAI|nr:phosphoesterase [Geoglobus acetivorans]
MLKLDNLVLSERRAIIFRKTGIIADLHLGIEGVLEEKGVAIPSIQIDEILQEIYSLIEEHRLRELIIAGDLKNEFGRNIPGEWADVRRFVENLREVVDLRVVRGNHDNYLQTILSGYGIALEDDAQIGEYTVVHGHNDSPARRIIMGHEHPSIKIRHSGATYSFPCFLRCSNDEREVWVLPSFSKFFTGSNILEGNFLSPILGGFRPEEIEVYAIEDGVYNLGNLKILGNVI